MAGRAFQKCGRFQSHVYGTGDGVVTRRLYVRSCTRCGLIDIVGLPSGEWRVM